MNPGSRARGRISCRLSPQGVPVRSSGSHLRSFGQSQTQIPHSCQVRHPLIEESFFFSLAALARSAGPGARWAASDLGLCSPNPPPRGWRPESFPPNPPSRAELALGRILAEPASDGVGVQVQVGQWHPDSDYHRAGLALLPGWPSTHDSRLARFSWAAPGSLS